jgi:predicted ATPase
MRRTGVGAEAPLLGRKRELADLRRLFLDGARLVTLVGPAGVGKSRLAREFAVEHGSIAVLDDARAGEVGAYPAIATAPEPLGVPGEHVYRLKPLAEAPAIELFRAHAQALEASYAELAALVRELGRLPAAIERAAARS